MAVLGVEVSRLQSDLMQLVQNAVGDQAERLVALMRQGDFRALAERHAPVAVETGPGHHLHRDGLHRVVGVVVPHGEERARRALDGRGFLPVPVKAQHQLAQAAVVGRQEDLADASAALDVHQDHRFVRRDLDEGPHLPALAEMNRAAAEGKIGVRGIGFPRAGRALFSGWVFRADLPGGNADFVVVHAYLLRVETARFIRWTNSVALSNRSRRPARRERVS